MSQLAIGNVENMKGKTVSRPAGAMRSLQTKDDSSDGDIELPAGPKLIKQQAPEPRRSERRECVLNQSISGAPSSS